MFPSKKGEGRKCYERKQDEMPGAGAMLRNDITCFFRMCILHGQRKD